jgi:hypothetical protein
MQSSSMLHPFSQKIFSRQSAILLSVPPFSQKIFSRQSAILLSVPPFSQKIFPRQNAILLSVPPFSQKNLFPSRCSPRQCSTCLARKSFSVNMQSPPSVPPVWQDSLFPVNLQSSSMFHLSSSHPSPVPYVVVYRTARHGSTHGRLPCTLLCLLWFSFLSRMSVTYFE